MMASSQNIIASTWAQRAQAELGAEMRFKFLIKRFVKHKIDNSLINLLVEAINDEKRHSKICADVAKKFGHKTGFETPNTNSEFLKKPWANLENERKILVLDMVLMCCITETINASLLNTIYSNSRASKVGKIIFQIFKDEVKHGKMGWAFLEIEGQNYDCSYISKYLPDMLEISINDELLLPLSGDEKHIDDIIHDGVLPIKHRFEQFKETFFSVVIPGFHKFNICTQSAEDWFNQRYPKELLRNGFII